MLASIATWVVATLHEIDPVKITVLMHRCVPRQNNMAEHCLVIAARPSFDLHLIIASISQLGSDHPLQYSGLVDSCIAAGTVRYRPHAVVDVIPPSDLNIEKDAVLLEIGLISRLRPR